MFEQITLKIDSVVIKFKISIKMLMTCLVGLELI